MPSVYTFTTTVQDVIDAVSQDIRQEVVSDGSDALGLALLIDYTNRTSAELLRTSRWRFLRNVFYFVTRKGQPDYWFGPTGSAPSDTVDLALNISDARSLTAVWDYSNFRKLDNTVKTPNLPAFQNFEVGKPREWQLLSTGTLHIDPAPDNQNAKDFIPSTPLLRTVAGGSLGDRVYRVAVTLVDALGNESVASRPAELFVPNGQLLVVDPMATPQNGIAMNYPNCKVYALADTTKGEFNDETGDLIFQAVVSINSTWTEASSGLLTSGANPPEASSIEPLDGYLLRVEYYKKYVKLDSVDDVLQIPDDFVDVVVAGVVARAFRFLRQFDDASAYQSEYMAGKTSMIRDINWYPEGPQFVSPDATTVGVNSPANGQGDLLVFA